AMAREAIELHLEGLIAEGLPIPPLQPIESHQRNADFRSGTWALIPIDASHLRLNAKRVNITMPERILDAVDRAAASQSQTRSGFLTQAATEYLRHHTPPTSKWRRRSSRRSPK